MPNQTEPFKVENVDVNYSYINEIYDGVAGRKLSRWTLLLPGSGCEWARKKHKGCSFCAFNALIDDLTGGRLLPYEEMMDVFEQGMNKISSSSPELVALFNGGNYINDKEIVGPAQIKMLEEVAKMDSVKTILFESKTEYLSAKKLDACLKAVGNKKLRIAIGLETKDDHLRNDVINKGMSKEAYERAIQRLHRLGIEVQSYVFMKPLTLTEDQAIKEAVDTINYAVECGSDIIMLEAAMVQLGTAFEVAYKKGEFDSPWLWSLRSVVEQTIQHRQLNVGIFDEEPKPLSYPKNCPKCTDSFNKAFHIFRETNDFNPLKGLDCSCKTEWIQKLPQFA